MIIALSIMAGILVAWLLFSSFFSDAGDLWDGICGLLSGWFQGKYRARSWTRSGEDDGDWISSGVRLFLLLALSGFCGYLAYRGLHKLFG